MKKIKLEYIVEHFQNCIEELYVFVDKETMELEAISKEAMNLARTGKKSEEQWMQDQIKSAINVLKDMKNKRFILLPNEDSIELPNLQEDFCYTLDNEDIKQKLLSNINGFGTFRNILEGENLIENWYEFEDDFYVNMAKKWCENNKIDYEM